LRRILNFKTGAILCYCYRFPVPDMRDETAITYRSQSKLRQELCYVDVTSLSFSTCLNHTPKLTRYEVQLKMLKGILVLCVNGVQLYVHVHP